MVQLSGNAASIEKDLQAFVDKYNSIGAPVASGELVLEDKKELVQHLIKALDFDQGKYQDWPSNLTGLALKTLRILSRERGGFEDCLNETVCSYLCQHAGLGTQVPDSFTQATVIESLKCLSNIQVHQAEMRTWFAESEYVLGLPMALKVWFD